MRLDEVRRLIHLVEESEIGELEVWRWWGRIRIRKTAGMNGTPIQVSAAGAMPIPAPVASPPSPEPVAAQDGPSDETAGLTPILSPMVGTFYRSPAPDAEAYVQVGDRVETGQTVCIIEAMKLMNEIQSEVRGKIVKIVAENAQPVEFGQTLFLVQAE